MDINKINIKLTKKQNMMIISVICFFATLIGVTYSWIAHDFLGGSNPMAITSISISLSYRGTAAEVIADLAPGETAMKTFTVTNNGEESLTYNLYWNVINDNFVDENYLLYSLEEETLGDVVTPRYLPNANNKYILYFMTIPPGETHDYTLTLTYVLDPNNDQSANMDKYFTGDIAISQTDQEIKEIIIPYIDEELVNVNDITSLAGYTIDENRTYCTDGSSIYINNNQFAINGMTNSTNCVVYLNSSSFIPTYTNQERYNYIYFDVNGGSISTNPSGYYQEGEDIVTATPTKPGGYSFRGWQVYGNDTTAVGNTVSMGTTYSYARALWSDTYTLTSTYSCADDGTSGLLNTGLPTSKQYNTTIQLPTPTKTRYGFVQWTVTGAGSSIDANNVLTMGPSDTTVNAVFVRTEWTKTTQTCSTNIAAYLRGYKVCERTISNYTKQTNYCDRSPWRQSGTKKTCVCPSGCSFSSSSVYFYPSCSTTGSFSCSTQTASQSYISACGSIDYAYNFGGTTTTTESSCAENIFDCNSGTYGSTKTACTTNYNYALGTTQTDVQQTCTVNSLSCNSGTYQQQQTDSCTVQYGYEFTPSNSTSSTCTVGSSFTCNSGTVNNTYVSACN